MRRRRWQLLWVSFLLTALLPMDGRAGPSPGERICEAARQEGTVHILTHVREVAEPLEKALKEKFPWLRVRTVLDVAAPTRAVVEAQAGRHEHDVFAYSLPGVLPLYERGLLASLSNPEIQAFGIHPGARLLGGAALSGWTFVHTIAYDVRRVRTEEIPKRWEDLLNPRWRGRLVGSISALTNGVAAVGLLLGEAWAFDFVRKLRDEIKVTLTPSPTLALQLLLQGEKDLLWSGIETTLERRERAREPISWAPVSPTYAARFVLTVFRNAPHPNAARCAALWLVSREGKTALEEASYSTSDASPGSPTRVRKEVERYRIRVFFENVESGRRRLELYGRLLPVLQG
ncbi:MAG: ABC transporter substrate-binding protein [Armatimonadota bacterium]|nr:ABC transporter substrate-binding protein [Armatimonadota bacterium]MDR7443582.1 ABC transporter substrate-binding protein [Armatimonadota bacterium]MDR7615549.1 ABC transporter substrate-binding protein [Armatimonadota bacterium]